MDVIEKQVVLCGESYDDPQMVKHMICNTHDENQT